MTTQGSPRSWFVAIILIALLAAGTLVGNSQTENPVTIAPGVTATSPADGATGVTINQPLSVTFSQPMSAASLSASLILFRPNGTMVSGGVSVYGRTAIFRPALNLMPNTTYTARVKAAASDLAGIAMGQAFIWSFTTGVSSGMEPQRAAPMSPNRAIFSPSGKLPIGAATTVACAR